MGLTWISKSLFTFVPCGLYMHYYWGAFCWLRQASASKPLSAWLKVILPEEEAFIP